MVIIKYDVLGRAEQVCTKHIYKLFAVANIVYFGNDREKILGGLRILSHWMCLMVLAIDW